LAAVFLWIAAFFSAAAFLSANVCLSTALISPVGFVESDELDGNYKFVVWPSPFGFHLECKNSNPASILDFTPPS